eukprot:TRINITY_DN7728_c0_g1_i4.p1 TRINITY_DN7728_c0_g1~~TRINITY_DN7728_c0_g1_i4.p1  ORF type:complete len:236 (+),score=34.35 TRINITY_DN7728_c0_g1_i4:38-745(+)
MKLFLTCAMLFGLLASAYCGKWTADEPVPVPGPRAGPSLSAYLWNQSFDIAEQVLQTPFLTGVMAGTWSPAAFGSFSIQDIAYCQHGANTWISCSQAAAKLGYPDLEAYAQRAANSWKLYVQASESSWGVLPDGVNITTNTESYIDFESGVVANHINYTVIAYGPCLVLWSWLGQQLSPKVADSNPYYSWVSGLFDPASVARFSAYVDSMQVVDWSLALQIYQTAMNHELAFFSV